MTKYTCPNGHEITANDSETPTCHKCELVATHYNGKTGEVYTWTPEEEHRRNCEKLDDMMNDAFCNQYFPDW